MRMRKVFQVCRERGIKLSPSKLQCGRCVKFGGMMIEAVGPVGEAHDNTVYISPQQQKVDDFLNIETSASNKFKTIIFRGDLHEYKIKMSVALEKTIYRLHLFYFY